MASLLHRLEVGLHRSAGASERLRSQVDRIDGYMRTSRLVNPSAISPLMNVPNGTPAPVDIKPVPSPVQYTATAQPIGTTGSMEKQMMQFQLPPELLAGWPWPLDNSHSDGFLPLAFE